MPRIKLPRVRVECERDGCHNTFEIKLGGANKYRQKYCSQKCAAIATKEARRHRQRKRIVKELSPRVRDTLKRICNPDPRSILMRIRVQGHNLSLRQFEELSNRYLELLASQQ